MPCLRDLLLREPVRQSKRSAATAADSARAGCALLGGGGVFSLYGFALHSECTQGFGFAFARIRFLIDDRVHFTTTREDWHTASPLAEGNPNAPFDRPFYIMANLAVGGAWPERENEKGLASSSLPNQFAIDWIRVYQCEGDTGTGLACIK